MISLFDILSETINLAIGTKTVLPVIAGSQKHVYTVVAYRFMVIRQELQSFKNSSRLYNHLETQVNCTISEKSQL